MDLDIEAMRSEDVHDKAIVIEDGYYGIIPIRISFLVQFADGLKQKQEWD